jgi:hypothetical protein
MLNKLIFTFALVFSATSFARGQLTGTYDFVVFERKDSTDAGWILKQDTLFASLRFTNIERSSREAELRKPLVNGVLKFFPDSAIMYKRDDEFYYSKTLISGLDTCLLFLKKVYAGSELQVYSTFQGGKLVFVLDGGRKGMEIVNERNFRKKLKRRLPKSSALYKTVETSEGKKKYTFEDLPALVEESDKAISDSNSGHGSGKPSDSPQYSPTHRSPYKTLNLDWLYWNGEAHLGLAYSHKDYFTEPFPMGITADFGLDVGLFQNALTLGYKGEITLFPYINQGNVFRAKAGVFLHLQVPNSVRVYGGYNWNRINYNVDPLGKRERNCSNVVHEDDLQDFDRKWFNYNILVSRGQSFTVGVSLMPTLDSHDFAIEYDYFPLGMDYSVNQTNLDLVTNSGRQLPEMGSIAVHTLTLKIGFRGSD